VTVVRFATGLRKAGTTVEEFQRHWRTTHAEAVLRMDGLTAYVQNHLILREDGTPWLPWPTTDAAAEIEWESVEVMEAAFASPVADDVRADSALFLEHGRGGLTVHTRRVLTGASHDRDSGVKLVTALRRFPGCGQDQLEETLAGPYAEAAAVPGALRHEQLVPVRGLAANEAGFCDAVDLLWFATAEEAAAFAVSEAAGRAAQALTGRAYGTERMVATPVRVR
jgi:uncharacterized protein (TIGR02118 family)